jgi:hypothetical protein
MGQHEVGDARCRRPVGIDQHLGFGVQALQVALDAIEGFAVDHRTDVRRQRGRVARNQFLRRAADHLDHVIGDALVDQQQAQRRATLARRAEGALDHGVDHLLRQRAGVDQHRVDAAGLRDQRHDGAVLARQRAMDDLRDLRRSGEDDPRHA